MTILSPCIKVCAIDPASGLCAGCGRTLDEIARWSTLDDTERARIMLDLPQRVGVFQGTGSAKVCSTLQVRRE